MLAQATEYEAVIGLEVHAQLKTRSKLFCTCATEFGKEPNSQTCPVCLGMPGVLPVLNHKALEYGIKVGIALNCQIAQETKFDRKNYFYADLPKSYQISQYDKPVCSNGYLKIKQQNSSEIKIRIMRAHLEEDAGKLVHAGAAGLHGSSYSFVDFNRSGIPLLEIVSAPDLRSPEEAKDYLIELRSILRYLEVCDGNLEEGSFRCDANVSIRPLGTSDFGTRTEIKNMNSFKAVQRAIQSEIDRQKELVNSGKEIIQETRLWNESSGTTFAMRSKEDANDYRYFPEPDLVPFQISSLWLENLRKELPELPEERRNRYLDLSLSNETSYILTENQELGNFFDDCLRLAYPATNQAKQYADFITGPINACLKESKKLLSETVLCPKNLSDIIHFIEKKTININTGRQILLDLLSLDKNSSKSSMQDISEIIENKGLSQVSDENEISSIVKNVILNNPSQLAEFKQGKEKVRQFFFGQIMKACKGKGNPQIINQILDKELKD